MASDYAVSVAGYSIEISFHDAVVIGLAILISLAFWAVLHYQRKRTVYLTHSEATNQVMLELSRIANALEDIANRPVDAAIASASHREQEQQYQDREAREPRNNSPSPERHDSEPQRQPSGMPYSLFGR